jgi:uncharacterized protein (TIGR03067 family)
MTVRVTCPNPGCGKVAEVDEQSLGRRGRCKKCGHVFALARPDGQPASAMSSDASAWKKDTAPATPTSLPEQFGRYRIVKTLGQGGMGAVYLAHDTRLDRQVALKVPFFTPADGPQAVQRFEREARAAATLDHVNLCPVYDVGEVDGVRYLTMPYVEGKTLAEVLQGDRSFTEAQAAAVASKLALALQEAHTQGIIHRDLKPGNIMINHRGELIVMDFGLARVVDGDDAPITRTGHVLGTALYMAPEQAAGEGAIGPACDVYALGVILHELLTGARPFEGPWSLVIGLKNVKDPEPPSRQRPGLSPALDAICLKAIARDPIDRYPTMAEFARALGDFLAGAGVPAKPSGAAGSVDGLVAEAFAGLVGREDTSILGNQPSASPNPSTLGGKFPSLPNWAWIATFAGGTCLLLGIVAYTTIGERKPTPEPVTLVTPARPASPNLRNPQSPRASQDERKAASGPTAQKVPSDLERLQGTWLHVHREHPGGQVLATVNETATYTGDRLTLKKDGVVYGRGIVTIHPERSPRTMDTQNLDGEGKPVGQPHHGIYKFENDRLILCLSNQGDERPTEFTTTSGPGWRLFKSVHLPESAGEPGAEKVGVTSEDPGKTASNAPKNPQTSPVMTGVSIRPGRGSLGGQWSIRGDRLIQSDAGVMWPVLMFGDDRWTDYDFSVDLMRTQGVGSINLFARCIDEKEHVDFGISAKGDFKYGHIETYENAKYRVLKIVEHKITNDRWYNARIGVRGPKIDCRIFEGGREILHLEASDDRHPRGKVGLATWLGAYEFKDIRVTAPDGSPLWDGLPAVGADASK